MTQFVSFGMNHTARQYGLQSSNGNLRTIETKYDHFWGETGKLRFLCFFVFFLWFFLIIIIIILGAGVTIKPSDQLHVVPGTFLEVKRKLYAVGTVQGRDVANSVFESNVFLLFFCFLFIDRLH